MYRTMFVALAAFVLAGCGGTPKDAEGKGLSVSPPSTVVVEQGTNKTFKVGVTKKGFTDAVKLTFTGLPDGVTLVESDTNVKDKEGEFTLKATDSAKENGEGSKATVKAEGGGKDDTKTFTVQVKKKK